MKHRYFILVLTSLLILTAGCDKGTNISITDDETIRRPKNSPVFDLGSEGCTEQTADRK